MEEFGKNTIFLKKDTVLVEEGERSNNLYILVGGCLGIFKKDKLINKFRDKGTILGEISLLLKKPRTATIKALEDSYVIKISGDIDEIIEKCPDVAKNIMINLADRLHERTEDFYFVSRKLDIIKKGK